MPPNDPDRSNVVNLDRRARKKRRAVPAIVVAAVVLVVIVLTFLVIDTLRETTPQWRERVSTASNQHSTVYLPDGSFMAVNGNTELLAQVFPRRREIALTRGEVWLQVSYQYLSTFSVTTGTEGVDIVPASESTPISRSTCVMCLARSWPCRWRAGRCGCARVPRAHEISSSSRPARPSRSTSKCAGTVSGRSIPSTWVSGAASASLAR